MFCPKTGMIFAFHRDMPYQIVQDNISTTLQTVRQSLPKRLHKKFEKQTVIKKAAKFCWGPQGKRLEVGGEYHAKSGMIYLFGIHGQNIKEKEIFYYYAHECGHKYFNEYIGGNELKKLLKLMSTWPLHEEKYRSYRAVKKVEEIFSDVFALFLRKKYHEARGMKRKADKIKRALNKKAPGATRFLQKSFKTVSRRIRGKSSETYPVTHQDFERLEKVFGSDLL